MSGAISEESTSWASVRFFGGNALGNTSPDLGKDAQMHLQVVKDNSLVVQNVLQHRIDFMPPSSQVIDALWHCLCPSSTVSVKSWFQFGRPIARVGSKTALPISVHRRTLHCAALRQRGTSRHGYKTATTNDGDNKDGEVLSTISKSAVYEELRKASTKGNFERVQRIVQILVEVRGEAPNSRIYTALILANTSAHHGTAAGLDELLEEMVGEGFMPDSATYHAALKVLAVHPNHVLRNEILDELRSRWFTLSTEGWHDVVVGCIRDRQIEVALDKLDQMHKLGVPVHSWLHDLFVYTFCETGDFDEVLRIMHYRVASDELDLSATLWYYILDTASRAYHYETTLWVWRKRVETGYLHPASGICINVLNTAARYGDFRLASDVFRILGNRTNSLQAYHYEALLESYLAADNLRPAISVLTLMTTSNVAPTEATTRSLYLYLRASAKLPAQALIMLRDLRKASKPVPTVAINAIIEASIHLNDLTSAIETYKVLHTICESGPTTATFNAIFRGCSKAGRKDLAMFMASEMLALKVQPDALTYDRLVLVCIGGSGLNDLDDGWRYFEEMKGKGWWPRRGTLIAMARRYCEKGDERVWELMEEVERRGMDVVGIQRWVGENWKRKEETTKRRWTKIVR
ncbi:hypothetical protein MMC15_004423 [Xylographa vitiligo]|nr:hypothetical protein [Xylographa vitiligo]